MTVGIFGTVLVVLAVLVIVLVSVTRLEDPRRRDAVRHASWRLQAS